MGCRRGRRPPYVSKDPVKGQVGFEVELAAALALELGRPIQFKQYNFNSLIPGLNDKHDFDFAMNGIEDVPLYRKQVRFSRPYYIYQLQLVVRKDEQRIHDFADLIRLKDQITVGTLDGSAAQRSLAKEGIKTRPFDSQDTLYLELDSKRIDAIYLDLPVHSYYLPKFPNLKLTGAPREKGKYAIAFRKDDEALAERFDKALDNLIKKGELRRIYKRWNIWNDDQLDLGAVEPETQAEKDAVAAGDPSQGWSASTYLWPLLEGAWMTIKLSVCSMLLAIALGLPIALARLYGPAPVRLLALLYIEFFRGIPVLLLLFFLYFGMANILPFDAFGIAVLGLGINYAAYEAEVYRSAISGVPAGQWEAATSLGMSHSKTLRRIILAQAIRQILPPMTNDFVALFKDTSVVSIIAVVELSKQYQILSKTSFQYYEIGLVTAALYLIMSVPLGHLSRYLEKRWGTPGND